MKDNHDTSNPVRIDPHEKLPGQAVQNPNPKANENIRNSTDEPKSQNSEPGYGVGSEITDGEDA